MKLLLVHEFYRSSNPSGEDKVYQMEQDLLMNAGIVLQTVKFRNDWIGTKKGPSHLMTALCTPWSPMGQRKLKDVIGRFKPDVVHFHNTFPMISQSAIWEAKRQGVATVQTLHNYRWFCANALLLRNERVCTLCLRNGPWPALFHRCYRNSLLATIPLVLNISLHRLLKTASRAINQLIVLTPFAKKEWVKAGIPHQKISVKANYFNDPFGDKGEKKKIRPSQKRHWIFIGRLKEEKGVQFLPQVWEKLKEEAPVLRIVGDGPMRNRLKDEVKYRKLDKKILFEGYLPHGNVKRLLLNAELLIFPSICYEGFPLAIGEAYASGVPVASSGIGAAGSLINDHHTGILFEPGDVDDMTRKLKALIKAPNLLKTMGINARSEYKKNYTPQNNLNTLFDIYEKAIIECRNNKI